MDHKISSCDPYGEEIKDGVCQEPRIHSLVCVNCRFNKGLSIKPKAKTKTVDLALGPVEITIEEPPSEKAENEAARALRPYEKRMTRMNKTQFKCEEGVITRQGCGSCGEPTTLAGLFDIEGNFLRWVTCCLKCEKYTELPQ